VAGIGACSASHTDTRHDIYINAHTRHINIYTCICVICIYLYMYMCVIYIFIHVYVCYIYIDTCVYVHDVLGS